MLETVGFTGARRLRGMELIYQILRERDRKAARLIERAMRPYRPFEPACPRCEPLRGRKRRPAQGEAPE